MHISEIGLAPEKLRQEATREVATEQQVIDHQLSATSAQQTIASPARDFKATLFCKPTWLTEL
jgi:hypothetical protein